MRIFNKINKEGNVCPICHTRKSGRVILIPILGTEDGNIIEGAQVHLDCLNLVYDEKFNIIYQMVSNERRDEDE